MRRRASARPRVAVPRVSVVRPAVAPSQEPPRAGRPRPGEIADPLHAEHRVEDVEGTVTSLDGCNEVAAAIHEEMRRPR